MQLQTFFVCLSGLLGEAPPSLKTHRLPKKKELGDVCLLWQRRWTARRKKDGGKKDWEDPLLLRSGAPSPAGQLAMPSATA